MLTPYVYAALAHERHQRFLTEAEGRPTGPAGAVAPAAGGHI